MTLFAFRKVKSHEWTFYDNILPLRPSVGARINGLSSKTLIREESENDAFHSPRSKKPVMDFLRQYNVSPYKAC